MILPLDAFLSILSLLIRVLDLPDLGYDIGPFHQFVAGDVAFVDRGVREGVG